jgi:hypothetical protein
VTIKERDESSSRLLTRKVSIKYRGDVRVIYESIDKTDTCVVDDGNQISR